MTNGCKLVREIGCTGITYCSIPLCEQGENCKQCACYHKDALIALAEEILSLRIRVKKLEAES